MTKRAGLTYLYEAGPGLIVLGVWALVTGALMLVAAPRLTPS